MVLFIGMEDVCLCIKAKSLVKKPFATLGIFSFTFSKGLVAAAGELFSAVKLHRESKLLELCGANVKEGNLVIYYIDSFSVLNGN